MNKKLLILGCGGHGKVIADVAEKCNQFEEISFLDKKFLNNNFSKDINSKKVIGDISIKNLEKFSTKFTHAFVGIGDNKIRLKFLKEIMKLDFIIPIIVDPSAEISKYAEIEKGCFINTNVVVQCNSKIEFGTILNTACTVDHDSRIGEGTHIAPGVNIAGHVNIGKYCLIGIGSQIIQSVRIGNDVIVGGGSLVLKDISNNKKAFGSPINIISNNN